MSVTGDLELNTISSLIANTSLNMGNFNINNLADSING